MAPLPPKKPKALPLNATESIYGPVRLWKRLAEIAAANDRSKSELVVGILELWLEDYDREQQQRRR